MIAQNVLSWTKLISVGLCRHVVSGNVGVVHIRKSVHRRSILSFSLPKQSAPRAFECRDPPRTPNVIAHCRGHRQTSVITRLLFPSFLFFMKISFLLISHTCLYWYSSRLLARLHPLCFHFFYVMLLFSFCFFFFFIKM